MVIATYTQRRWSWLEKAVESARRQIPAPDEVIICVDHNDDLVVQCNKRWCHGAGDGGGPPVIVVDNRYAGHLGAARTTATELARGEVLVFLDDDAVATEGWLSSMLTPLADPSVVAVGGAPIPNYSRPRPGWFPPEFDWIFGCAYRGLPKATAPVPRVIGATMAVRRADLMAIDGFRSDFHDDLDMSHRLLAHFPGSTIVYEPSAVVSHRVHEERLTWHYFWRRAFQVNRSKPKALRRMGGAGNLVAERAFARRALTTGVLTGLREFVSGDLGGLQRVLALCAGLGCAGVGYAVGTLDWAVGRRVEGP